MAMGFAHFGLNSLRLDDEDDVDADEVTFGMASGGGPGGLHRAAMSSRETTAQSSRWASMQSAR